ncbi:MAG: polyphosphate kinase 1 [Tannerellaceae bacterium]|jgi:polyphosphate kinase|nr:polyphosphate kinase 1 [Tannerellaceae bacterium]
MPDEQIDFRYFKRDLSWLSFNYRVLLEAEDDSLPIYERINFLSIYSSNLEEFYEIRVAEHRAIIMKRRLPDDQAADPAEETLAEITAEVNRQQREYYRIFYEKILPELRRKHIILYQNSLPEPFHTSFIRDFFIRDVFPFLAPVVISPGQVRTFLRDRRLYLVVRMTEKGGNASGEFCYVIMKIPFAKVPRFVELPDHEGKFFIMFIDDIIRANLEWLFPGYEIDGCFSIKISRDADIYLDDLTETDIVTGMRRKLRERKNGNPSRFMYDSAMPQDFLNFVCRAFDFTTDDLVAAGRYLNLQDLKQLPRPSGDNLAAEIPKPMRLPALDASPSIMEAVCRRDILLHFPYQSFNYLIRLLKEAATDPTVAGIKITQYRVAEQSEVIIQLIAASRNGKNVTVHVEPKARFDEENNMITAEQMEKAGIRIIYNGSRLKVHAKLALVTRRNAPGLACISTGNFNEKTAGVYSDMALLTADPSLAADVEQAFAYLENDRQTLAEPGLKMLLVTQYNMVDRLHEMIEREMQHAAQGRKAKIILKMNGLHDRDMINRLYCAGMAGVEINLIVRGICCLIPNMPFSPNIRITRLVDMFLEHARIWYFGNDGQDDLYLSSADWMRRNLNRRIEAAAPINDPDLKREILHILHLQLADNVKACTINANLNNVFKPKSQPYLRAQVGIYEYLKTLGETRK